jgi:hypothetical protein
MLKENQDLFRNQFLSGLIFLVYEEAICKDCISG